MNYLEDLVENIKTTTRDFNYEFCDNCGEWVNTHNDDKHTLCDVCDEPIHTLSNKS